MSKHTDDELKKASDHLFYEVWMMRRLSAIFKRGIVTTYAVKPVAHTNLGEMAHLTRSTGHIKTSDNIGKEEELRIINNALIEAFAIHVRALLDFFYSQGRDDDIVAEQFFSTPAEWRNARPHKTKNEIEKIRNRVNKEIAHLTYARQRVRSKEWPFEELLKEIDAVCEAFEKTVPARLLGSRWK